MEDTKSLVTIFLQKIFHDRQHIIDNTFKLIYDFNNGDRKKVNYEKTLKNICSLLGKEIPNQVLVYLLTLVDMPLDMAESDDNQFIEKIKTLEEIQMKRSCLADSIKPHLECIKNENEEQKSENVANEENKQFLKPKTRRRKMWTQGKKVEPLLDLTANAVIKNHENLKNIYQKKFEKAWNLIKSNKYSGEPLKQCYDTLGDLNKKRKLLRDIENDNITEEMVRGLYKDVDIFLKEKHIYDAVSLDLFKCAEKILK